MSPADGPVRPFWDWLDAALFVGLLAPCGAAAYVLSKGLFRVFPLPNQLSFLLTFQFLGYGLWLTAMFARWRVPRFGAHPPGLLPGA